MHHIKQIQFSITASITTNLLSPVKKRNPVNCPWLQENSDSNKENPEVTTQSIKDNNNKKMETF